ncbi:MAG: hypothetical protein QOG72_1157 [Sphingomonadales bacterium]|jgi:hypothetical protein|nr:hypothetical protein [Sphingomonadales bacterium]
MAHDRSNERVQIQALLESGTSLLMLAPRRVGKTWLLKAVEKDMTAAGWQCIRVDVEGRTDESGFLREVCAAIEKTQEVSTRFAAHLKQRMRQASMEVKGASLADLAGTVEVRSFLETLVETLNDSPKRVLILIDELAVFLLELSKTNPPAARGLLHHLRKLQQGYERVQWFLTGSVGLDVVGRRHDMLGTLHEYDTFELHPFTPEEARSYLSDLKAIGAVTAFDFAPGGFDHLVESLGWLSPYYLRQIALLIKASEPPADGSTLPQATPADIDAAIAGLLGRRKRTHFATWEEHIVKNFEPAETKLLRAILDVAAEAAEGAGEAAILSRLTSNHHQITTRELKNLLQDLESDGYISKRDRRWCFQSNLLRRYWMENMAQ